MLPLSTGKSIADFENIFEDGSCVLIQSQLDTSYSIGLAIFVLAP
jgi:hypothetical protein